MNNNLNNKTENTSVDQTTGLIEKVNLLLKDKQYDEAIKTLDMIIESNPGHLKALSLKGDTLYEQERYNEAADCYDKIAAIDPAYLDGYVWNDIGSAFFNNGQYKKADAYYDRAIEVDPNLSWAWRNKGLVKQREGQNKAAIECYDKAIAIEPHYNDAFYDKGTVLFELGEGEEALSCFDEVIKLDPGYIWAWGMKARTLELLHRDEEALASYEKATELDAKDIITWNDKGNLFYKLKEYGKALACYNKVIELDPESTYGWSNKALALSLLDETNELPETYQKVVDLSEKAVISDPGNVSLWSDMGFAYEYLENYDRAEECFNKVLELDKDNTGAIKGRGLIYSEHKYDFAKALDATRKLIELEPDNLVNKLALVEDLIKCKKYDEALKVALDIVTKLDTERDGCMVRYFIFASNILMGNTQQAGKALGDFFQYYTQLPPNFIIHKGLWVFNGLVKFLGEKSIHLQYSFMLLTLIDLMQGKIKAADLTFGQIISNFQVAP